MASRLMATGLMLAAIAAPTALLARDAARYPEHQIRMVVPYPPGGATGILARMVAGPLGEALGQVVVVENKLGASSNIGTQFVAHAKPDGYTLLLGNSTGIVINRNLYRLDIDPARKMAPVILVALVPSVLYVHPSIPARDIAEFLELVKKHPHEFSFATPGIGSAQHIAGKISNSAFGLDMLHVPFAGSGPAIESVVSGQVPVGIDSLLTLKPFIEAHAVRPLATTGAVRAASLPDVPTLAELGAPGLDLVTWYAVFAPPATPKTIVDRVNSALRAILTRPDVKQRLADLGSTVQPGTAEEFARFVQEETVRWERVVKTAHMDAQ